MNKNQKAKIEVIDSNIDEILDPIAKQAQDEERMQAARKKAMLNTYGYIQGVRD